MAEQTYSNKELNYRFLRSLPDEWDTYSIVIRSQPDFAKLSLQQLYVKLLALEEEVNQKKLYKL